MRNLKRVLALALALVMMLGMMITASAATYADKDAIDPKYAEAVEVLTGMGIFKGTGAGFAPKAILDRASASALIYRVITGDVNDKQVDLYDYSTFADVQEGAWYTGYITYAANGGYIKGYAGNAMPNDTVTGIQVLAIMLRAAGYGQNGEYEGAAWKDNILTEAKELGITAGIATNDLDKGATRELVAQLIFNAITKVKMVAYSPILNNYIPVTITGASNSNINFATTQTLAQKVFDLNSVDDLDKWGRPAKLWFADNKAADGKYTAAKETLYASIAYDALVSYTTEEFECDIAADLGLRKSADIESWYINGKPADVTGEQIDAIFNGALKIGAQGQLTEIYDIDDDGKYEIVTIDTYLAKVADVIDLKYDKNSHKVTDAKMYLDVYNVANGTTSEILLTNDKVNFEYAAGDMVLVNVHDTEAKSDVLGLAESMVGAQTAWTISGNTHEVEDAVYNDAIRFYHDDSDKLYTVDYTWYFDQYGNLIGSFEIATKYSYGTISAIKWYEQGATLDNGYAIATITYMDGTQETATVYSIDGTVLQGVEGMNANYEAGKVSSTKQYNDTYKVDGQTVTEADYTNVGLYKISSGKDGLILTEAAELVEATFETGVPALTADVNAGSTTMFLVWNGKTYETYTGIKNIPTYSSYDKAWYVDTARVSDGVANYVFITSPVDTNTYKTVTFFWDASLNVKAHLKNNSVDYYTITGGYVNGVKDTVYTKSWAVVEELTSRANADTLLTLDLTNGYVGATTDIAAVTDAEVEFKVDGKTYYAVYALAAKDASLVDGVLMANGEAYDVDGLETFITYNGETLKDTIRYDDAAYLYVVYTEGRTGIKIAQVVYATDKAGTIAVPVEPEVSAYDAAVAAAKAALEADPKVEADLTDAKADLAALTGLTAEQAAYVEDLTNDIDTALAAIELAEAQAAVVAAKAAKDAAYAAYDEAADAADDAATAATNAATAVTNAQSDLTTAQAAVAPAESDVADAEQAADLAAITVEAKRQAMVEALADDDASNDQAATDAYTAAQAALTAAEEALAAAEEALADAQAAVTEAQAALTAAQAAKTAADAAKTAADAAKTAKWQEHRDAQAALQAAEDALAALQ